jgi:hypothetical protein
LIFDSSLLIMIFVYFFRRASSDLRVAPPHFATVLAPQTPHRVVPPEDLYSDLNDMTAQPEKTPSTSKPAGATTRRTPAR